MTVPHQPDSRNRKIGTVRDAGSNRWKGIMKFLRETSVLVSASELGQVLGTDLETVNNWIRRGIISRAQIGGRKLRNRLFSTEEVYKTALKNELVKLGIPPSPASEAVNALWKEWDRKKDVPEGRNIYAVVLPSNDKWTVALCSQKISGGLLHKFGKSKSIEEMDLPKQAFAVIPISEVFGRASKKLSELLNR
jgi:hypothetical protein